MRPVLPLIIEERDRLHRQRLLLEERVRGLEIGLAAVQEISDREDEEARRSAQAFAKLGYTVPSDT